MLHGALAMTDVNRRPLDNVIRFAYHTELLQRILLWVRITGVLVLAAAMVAFAYALTH